MLDQPLVVRDHHLVKAAQTIPKPLIGLEIFLLKSPQLFDRDHRNARVRFAEDFALGGRVEPVGQLRESLMQRVSECRALGNGCRHLDRSEARDVLVPDLTFDPARLDQADLQAERRLPTPDEHRSGTLERLWIGVDPVFGVIGIQSGL